MKTIIQKRLPLWLILTAVVLVVCVSVLLLLLFPSPSGSSHEIITISTIENIIHVNELSTFTAVYNGIATIQTEDAPEKIDYYTSYEARINAGIDFEQIGISIDTETKTIHISIPEVQLTDVIVDITSLDFIFLNDDANTSAITQQAFKACEMDARTESQAQGAIFDLAKQNAENILSALIRPLIEQLDEEYKLVIA